METQSQYRQAVEPVVATIFQSPSWPEQAIFRKEGEYWTVGCRGNAFRLKDTKGLAYIAHLLRHPAAEFHVLDLAGGMAGQRDADEMSHSGLPRGAEDLEKAGVHIASLGDAGEMLDDQAKTAYRRRLSDLREELEEAKELGNVERAEKAEHDAGASDSSGQSGSAASSPNHRDLSRRMFRKQSSAGQDSGRAYSDGDPSAQAGVPLEGRYRADVTHAKPAPGCPGESREPRL
jgi:uncharacterized membrane protein